MVTFFKQAYLETHTAVENKIHKKIISIKWYIVVFRARKQTRNERVTQTSAHFKPKFIHRKGQVLSKHVGALENSAKP